MKSSHWSGRFRDQIIAMAAGLCLCSCEADLFGPESRELAGGYGLRRVEDSNQIALTIPNRAGGIVIDEIGWREPYIIARASGSSFWEAMNTARAERISISDTKRKSDPKYQSIVTEPAESAWAKLKRHKRLW
jgi:hypothetical protein